LKLVMTGVFYSIRYPYKSQNIGPMESDAKMNLLDFENHINDTILARGWEYYRGDCIKSIKKKDKNYYTAIVAGTYDYNVIIGLGDEGVILSSDCDCP